MRAVTWVAPRRVSVADVPDPKIVEPTDAIIRVTASGICGSDLHLYEHGSSMAVLRDDILGHEPMAWSRRPAPRSPTSDPVTGWWCRSTSRAAAVGCAAGTSTRSVRRARTWTGARARRFGYTHMYGGMAGAQAEYLRVPQAHFGPIKVDGEAPDAALMLLSDVLPTSWQAVEYAEVPPDGTLAVFGLGPIGQLAARIALYRGAGRVIGIDPVADRREFAARAGVEMVDPSAVDDVVDAVRSMTGGRGADSVIDAVGMDASGSVVDRALQLIKLKPDRTRAPHQSLARCALKPPATMDR